jgi:hypothetical protein
MTPSPFQILRLVQLVPDGEWLVAIPAADQSESDNPSQWAVDVYKDLSFADLKTTVELAAMKTVPPLNRFVPMQLAFVPALNEASAFALLSGLIRAVLPDSPEEELDPPERMAALTLYGLLRAMGRGLREALTAAPERVETLYAAHDLLAYTVQSQLRAAGLSPETALADKSANESGDESADDALPPEETT